MTKTHIPVLAGELIDLVDPRPGEIAVDCTVGGGGHARLIADRLGPAGTLIGVDRDPLAEERFAALAAEVQCETRFIRADFVTALHELREERLTADLIYLDLGMSSMQVDTWERGFSYAYDAPLDMRMDPAQDADRRRDRQHLGRAAAGPAAARVRRGALRLPDRPRDRPRAPPRRVRLHPAAGRRDQDRGPGARPSSPAAIPPSGPSRRCASPSTTSSPSWRRRCPLAWELLGTGGRLAAISFHSLEDRLVKRFLGGAGARAASARPSCRSASADASRRPSSSPVAPWLRHRAKSPPIPDPDQRTCAPPASWRSYTHDAIRAHARRPREHEEVAPGRPVTVVVGPQRRSSLQCAPPGGADGAAPRLRTGGRGVAPAARLRRRRGHRGPAAHAHPPARASPAPAAPPRRGPASRSARPATKAPWRLRTSAYVRALPDHALLDRIIRGRAWIPLLGVLLAGIVAMQVEVLKLNAGIGRSLERSTALQGQNELLRASVAGLSDEQRIERHRRADGHGHAGAQPAHFRPRGAGSVEQALSSIHAPNATNFIAQLPTIGAPAAAQGTSGNNALGLTPTGSTAAATRRRRPRPRRPRAPRAHAPRTRRPRRRDRRTGTAGAAGTTTGTGDTGDEQLNPHGHVEAPPP